MPSRNQTSTTQRRLIGRVGRSRPAALRVAAVYLMTGLALGASVASSSDRVDRSWAVGTWWAEYGAARVEISECGDTLCGKVIWLRSPFDEHGCEMRDRENPDAALRERPVLGMEILTGLVPDRSAPGRWAGGTVYDPGSGSTYRCSLTVEDTDVLHMRGYIGIPLIGRTVRWFRVGTESRLCSESSGS